MKLTQVLLPVAVLGGVVAAYFGGLQGSKTGALNQGLLGGKIANSPVMASGGSMTFRTSGGWACDTVSGQSSAFHTKCVSSGQLNVVDSKGVPIGTIDWDNVLPPDTHFGTPATNFGALGWSGLATPWSLDIWARDKNGKAVTSGSSPAPVEVGEVRMCTVSAPFNTSNNTAPQCDTSAAYAAGSLPYILIYVNGSSVGSGGTLGLLENNVNDPATGLPYAVQYYDSKCTIHDASQAIPGCEHPGIITSSLDSSSKFYVCKDGNCVISID
jgi:hypothetical protein